MTRIAFIGLGHMGLPMATHLLTAGYAVQAYDCLQEAREAFTQLGGHSVSTLAKAVQNANVLISILPAGPEVKATYFGKEGILELASTNTLLIESSTIDVATALTLHKAAAEKGFSLLDAPVSGGTSGAKAATLTFMVGSTEKAFQQALPYLQHLGQSIFHIGGPGHGQGAKICNNLLLAITMLGTAEAFKLGEKLGLNLEKLFEVINQSSGQCWSVTHYCPVPGLVPKAPANNQYAPGFTTAMMLKDLRLASDAAKGANAAIPLGELAKTLYTLFYNQGGAQKDFSGIIEYL